MKRTARPPSHIPKARTVALPPKDYQPSKAEMEEETDMPSMSEKQLKDAFFRPFRFNRKGIIDGG